MIGVLETGHANIRSIKNTIENFGYDILTVSSAAELSGVDKLILPGVGAFPAVMDHLRQTEFEAAIVKFASSRPILGICLGMQLLFESSEELGGDSGLSLVSGHVQQLPANRGRVPHIGWNEIEDCGKSVLMDGIEPKSCAYFVHSFHCVPVEEITPIFTDFYGMQVLAGFEKGHIFGVQFHPEKSQKVGERVLKNFLEFSEC